MRRDSPQASRRAGRLILSSLTPGCSVAGDQDPSKFPVRVRCRIDVRNASSSHRGRDLPCRALGKADSGGGWLRVQLEQPGVLLLRRLGPRGPMGVAVATFGHTGLGMLICRKLERLRDRKGPSLPSLTSAARIVCSLACRDRCAKVRSRSVSDSSRATPFLWATRTIKAEAADRPGRNPARDCAAA